MWLPSWRIATGRPSSSRTGCRGDRPGRFTVAGPGVGQMRGGRADPKQRVADRFAEADQLALVARVQPPWSRREAVAELAGSPRVSGSAPEEEVIASAMVGELQVVLGVGARPAGRLIDLAHRLTTVLPDTLAALARGPVGPDPGPDPRGGHRGAARDRDAREVQDRMLAVAGPTPVGRALAAVLAGPDRAHRDPGGRRRGGAAPEGATGRAVGALGADRGRDGRADHRHRRRRCGDDRTGAHRPGPGPGRPTPRTASTCRWISAGWTRSSRCSPASGTGGTCPGSRSAGSASSGWWLHAGHVLRDRPGRPRPRGGPWADRAGLPRPGHRP